MFAEMSIENGYIERKNGSLRREFLNVYLFNSPIGSPVAMRRLPHRL